MQAAFLRDIAHSVVSINDAAAVAGDSSYLCPAPTTHCASTLNDPFACHHFPGGKRRPSRGERQSLTPPRPPQASHERISPEITDADDAMARDQESQTGHRRSRCSHSARGADRVSLGLVGAGLAARDQTKGIPHAELERRPRHVHRHVENRRARPYGRCDGVGLK
jgi:hypothetical protein